MKSNAIIDCLFTEEETTEPVLLAEAKAWLKVSSGITDDDALITELITTARQQCEEYLCISLIPRIVTATIQNDLGNILLPYQPMRKATDEAETVDFISIVDVNGDDVSTDNYKLVGQDFKRLQSWFNPTPQNNFYNPPCWTGVVSYNAGYAADELPKMYKTAILNRIARLYEARGDDAGNEFTASEIVRIKPLRKVV